MQRALIICGLLAIAGAWPSCGGSSPEAASPESAENQAVERAAEAWLALLDAGNYEESWSTSATVFRTGAGSPESWANAAGEMRAPLGRMISRRLKQAAPTTLQEGAAYALAFETSFEARPNSTEEVTVVLDGGFWKVAGYLVH